MISRLPARWGHFYTGELIKSSCVFPKWQLTQLPSGSNPNIKISHKPRITYRFPYKNKEAYIIMKYSDFNRWFIKNNP